MIEKIKSIMKAYNDENYLAALALTLTLPDICAQVEFPEINYKNFGNGYVGKRYKKWFDLHLKQYFGESGTMSIEEDDTNLKYLEGKKKYVFDGKACYALRCSVLHEGNDDISSKTEAYNFLIYAKNPDNSLPISINSVFSHSHQTGEVKQVILLDLDEFCYIVCKEAEESYLSNPESYSRHSLPIKIVPLNTVEDIAKILENIGLDCFDNNA